MYVNKTQMKCSIEQKERKHSSTFSKMSIENRVTEEKIAQG